MLDTIDEHRSVAELYMEEVGGVDLSSKHELLKFIDTYTGDLADMHKPMAAAALYGIINKEDTAAIIERINANDDEVSKELFIVLAGTLKEEGQDYYLEKLLDGAFSMKYVVLHAIHKFGDESFIKPCGEYLKTQMVERPTMEEVRAFIQGRSKK